MFFLKKVEEKKTMDTEFRLLYPNGYKESDQARMKSYDFIKRHYRSMIWWCCKMTGIVDILGAILEKVFFFTDPEVLEYRQAIVEDLVKHPKLYQAFCSSVSEIQNVSELRRVLSSDFSVDSALSVCAIWRCMKN